MHLICYEYLTKKDICKKNPAYRRHWVSWLMGIVSPLPLWRKQNFKKRSNFFFLKIFFKASALWADAFYKLKCPSVCVFVHLCVCLFTFEVPFNGLFPPTSRSRMSNMFRDSESLGKSNGKKWSNIWTFLFGNGLRWPCKKVFCCCWFCGL